MRVLLISGSIPPMKCGIGDYTSVLAEALSREPGVSVAVLTDGRAQPVPSGRRYETLAVVTRGWRFSDFPTILRVVRHWRPDIVHMQFPTKGYGDAKSPWLLPPILSLLGHSMVQTWHEYVLQGGVVQNKNSLLHLPAGLTSGGLVVVRPQFKERMSPWYRWTLARKKFRFIPSVSLIPKTELGAHDRGRIRRRFVTGDQELVVFFGFAAPFKGATHVFDVADPNRHHLVLSSDLSGDDPYQAEILKLVDSDAWAGHATVVGWQPPDELACLLAAADAVVLPFVEGGGSWSTSLAAARAQGTFVVTTSTDQEGYDSETNTYFARPGDSESMRSGLLRYSGRRATPDMRIPPWDWAANARVHRDLYGAVLRKKRRTHGN